MLFRTPAHHLTIRQQLGDSRGIAECLESFAKVAVKQYRFPTAARLFGHAEILRNAIGVPVPLNERESYNEILTLSKGASNDGEFAAGREMSLDNAVSFALAVRE